MSTSRVFVWGVVGLVVLVVGLVVYMRQAPTVPMPAPTQPVSQAIDQVEMAATYRRELTSVTAEVSPFLDRELGPSDVPALQLLRERLVLLTVPRGAQQNHLAITLALSRLTELLQPGRVVVASRAAPTLRGTQAELKQIITRAATP